MPAARLLRTLRTLIADAWDAVARWPRGRVLLIAAGLSAVLLVSFFVDVPNLDTLRAWSEGAGAWFPVLFFFLYIAITQLPIPRTLLTLSSGILFGPLVGCVIALSATTVSATISLIVVRSLGAERVRHRMNHPAVERINARLRRRGWLAVASLRMIAAVPFSILNYTAAFTQVPVVPFAVATLVGSAPGTIATVVVGNTLVDHSNPAALVFSLVLLCIGVGGLVVDAALPVRAPQAEPSAATPATPGEVKP